ncbi:MAG: hypothetical protein A2133_02615 [Actinobacteria bacterium RBG_16_64_13]|nr:MAG: hypothetical protein A2133_02615 [Actinobacteria bacterium RBG_16_64_13]
MRADDRATLQSRRLLREQDTIEVMIRMYCRSNHRETVTAAKTGGAESLCERCAALLEYSRGRVRACRFGDEKPICANCTVHCFRTEMREQTRVVMRYSGPRMTLRHPYLAIRHLLDRRQPCPSR